MNSSSLTRVGRRRLRAISIVCLILSLFLPSFFGSDMRGLQVLTMGWIAFGARDWLLAICWLAMFGSFASLLISSKRRKLRMTLAFASILSVAIMGFTTRVPVNDTGDFITVIPGIGFIVWTLGCFGVFVYHLERWKQHKR